MLNEDYKEMLKCSADEGVKFLIVGAYAMAAHGFLRATMDINIWVMPWRPNAEAVLRALRRFGAPRHGLTIEDLQREDTVFQTGAPLVVRGANNFTGISRPNLVCDPNLPENGRTVGRWFNTTAFANPPNFTIGNVQRTMPNLRGPAYNNLDTSVFRNMRITERLKLEFRAEAFNTLNTVVYNNPNTSFTPNAAGVNTNPNFGRITSSLNARRLQFGLRLVF